MSRLGPKRIAPRAIAATAVAGGIAAAAVVQGRHLRGLARDEDLARLSAPLGGRELQIVSADGTVLHAEEFGPPEAPTVVLAHGWTERLTFWGPVIKRLTAHDLRVVAYDLRGHGESANAVDSDYSLERFGDDVEAVLVAAGAVDRPATVAGHSLGAMSIAAWAQHHDPAARAGAAALVSTGLGDLIASNLLLGELAKWLNHPWTSRAVMKSKLRVPPFSTPLQQALIRHAAFGPEATAGEVAFYERMLIECHADTRAAVGVALSDMDLWDAVEKLTIPTLVIVGARDRLTPPVHSQRLVKELPQPVGLIELPDTGHMSPLERPDEISAALERLVRETAPSPSRDAVGGRT